jgi:hypothetical protein
VSGGWTVTGGLRITAGEPGATLAVWTVTSRS